MPAARAAVALAASLPAALILALAGAPQASAQGSRELADPCLRCDRIYGLTPRQGLWEIDPDTLTARFLSDPPGLPDLAIDWSGRMFVPGAFELSACDGTLSPAGFQPGNGQGGHLLEPGLFGQGPPLTRLEAGSLTTVGGAVGPAPPDWCGDSTGDVAMRPSDGLLYSTVDCDARCRDDVLQVLDPETGQVLREVGCVVSAETGLSYGHVLGLAFDHRGRLWGGLPTGVDGGRTLILIDPETALAETVPITGFEGFFGLASIPCPAPNCAAGAVQVVGCAERAPGDDCVEVQLDGSGSSAGTLGDLRPLSFDWTVDCAGDLRFATGESPTLCLPAGCTECLVELRVTDGDGFESACTSTVEIRDETPPELSVPASRELECPAPPGGLDAWLAAASAEDDCSGATLSSRELLREEGCGGTFRVVQEWSAVDGCGNEAAPRQAEYRVVDEEPPRFESEGPLFELELWPPSHGYAVFELDELVRVEDDCGEVEVAITGCASSQPEDSHGEPGGDGRFLEDCVVSLDGRSFATRAERHGACGAGSERVYTVEVTAVDVCGNAAVATGLVRVPHDRSEAPPATPPGRRLAPHAPPPFPWRHETTYGPPCR